MGIQVSGIDRLELLAALISTGKAAAAGSLNPISEMVRFPEWHIRYLRVHSDDDSSSEAVMHEQMQRALGVKVELAWGILYCDEYEDRFPGLAKEVVSELYALRAQDREALQQVTGGLGMLVASFSGAVWALVELIPAVTQISTVLETSPTVCVVSLPFAILGWLRGLSVAR